MRQRSPNALVPDIRAAHLVKHAPVDQPPDHLAPPVPSGVRPVDLQRPRVPVVAAQADGAAAAVGLVARPAAVAVAAVRRAVRRRQAVDRLHDVQLAAQRPGRAAVDGVAEQPEGGPDALLLALRVVAEADGRLEERHLARGRREGRLGLDAGRGPGARGRLARDELDRVAARELEVLVGRGVGLDFVVRADAGKELDEGEGRRGGGEGRCLLGDQVPPALVWSRAGATREGVGPDELEAWIDGGRGGRSQRAEQGQ